MSKEYIAEPLQTKKFLNSQTRGIRLQDFMNL